jgi:hypothetical protein
LEDFHYGNRNNNNESKNVAQKIRIILKASQKYQLYVEQAKKNLKFSDPMNLVDATEFLSNGEIEYRNAKIQGLGNTILSEVNVDQIADNVVKYINNLNKYYINYIMCPKLENRLNSVVCIF